MIVKDNRILLTNKNSRMDYEIIDDFDRKPQTVNQMASKFFFKINLYIY